VLIRVTPCGPYLVAGGVPLITDRVLPTGEVYTLCRCGRSARRPFCDSTHRRIGFAGAGTADGPGCDVGTGDGPAVTVRPGGPLVVTGAIPLQLEDGSTVSHERYALCRCGASRTKPFCDGSHRNMNSEGE
jgi:CDGSH-type Zn-finger protein